MTYRPNAYSTATDSRFFGIQRTDLRARYGAPLDGNSHPLPAAEAVAAYPNITVSGSTIEHDTAAWLQAEYDLRTAGGGIIGLPDNSTMIVSQQLWLQNATAVGFYGGRNVVLKTQGTGTTPAIRVTAAYTNALPLRDLYLLAQGYVAYVSASLSGTAHTSFKTGSTAILVDYSTQCEFINLHWNGYDQPLAFGQNTFCLNFRQCRGDACNAGVSWSSPTYGGLNSMERMVFENCTFGNNNYGFDINTAFTENGSTYNQGGSWFFLHCSIDYNVVRQGRYLDVGGPFKNSGLFVKGNHIETSGANSGTSLARFQVQGSAFFAHNEFSEQSGGVIGLVEVMPNASCAMTDNRCNQINVPFMYGVDGSSKNVNAFGNVSQNILTPVIMLQDGNGVLMQRGSYAPSITINADGGGLPLSYQGCAVINFYYNNISAAGTFTIPAAANIAAEHSIGTQFKLVNLGVGNNAYPITIGAASGASVGSEPGPFTLAKGGYCVIQNFGLNNWVITEGNLVAP